MSSPRPSISLLRALAVETPKARGGMTTPFNSQHRLYAHQSYGGGEGDPKGENPQQQGSNPSADLEHPGPPPPDVGKGTGGGPTKASGSKEGTSTGKQQSSGAQPKILDESPPTEPSEEVKKHNREMDQRHDKATSRVDDEKKDKVGKGYWSGHGGADREP